MTVIDFKSKVSGAGEKHVVFDLAAEDAVDYLSSAPADPPFVLEGLIYRGTVTQLIGVIKSGKSTWLFTLLRNLLDGKPFMGQKTETMSVLYVSEQPRSSLSKQMIAAGLDKKFRARLHVVDISKLWSKPWADNSAYNNKTGETTYVEGRASAIRKLAAKIDAGLVIIDTFPRLAQITEMASIGEMNEAMESIAPIISDGRAIILGWHDRKAGGVIFEAAAGTAASGGAMDMMIRLQRIPGAKTTDRTRSLEATGRFDCFAADGIAIQLNQDASDYKVMGEAEVAAKLNTEALIQAALDEVLPESLSFNEIKEKLAEKARASRLAPPARSTIQAALSGRLENGFISREGKGTKKSPYLFKSTEVKSRF